jgi:hypothetical protein
MDDQPLVTLSELGRLAGTTGPRVLQLFRAGVLGKPDFTATSGSILFDPKRVGQLVNTIKNYGIQRSINAARSRR